MTGDFEPSARVIADSVSPHGHRLTTMEVRFHRFVLAEFNTHRTFSRNSASSRAIPVSKTVKRVNDEPAVPLSWAAEQKGMQGGEEISFPDQLTARAEWLAARDAAVYHAGQLVELGVHKSIVNRLLEPFMPHTAIISATDWDGFWQQRCSVLAQPEIAVPAALMREAYLRSEPVEVKHGEWHLPYITAEEHDQHDIHIRTMLSVARCARVSYLTHDGRRDIDADVALYHRLVWADPPHYSPMEHVATPAGLIDRPLGNFEGWHQLRHTQGI